MKLIPLPAFDDNYIWMLQSGTQALVVDPGDAAPVLQALASAKLTLCGILITHHHPDHTGGVDALRQATGAAVFGPARENMPEPLTRLRAGDTVQQLGLAFSVLDVPGHTAGHIAYYCNDVDAEPLLFCGDTLFSAGCGRLFEGTPAQMQHSLGQLAALPDNTRVCCTHEYTLSNLRFARMVDPNNARLQAYEVECLQLRQAGVPTLPSRIGLERQINPFLRTDVDAVIASIRHFDAEGYQQDGAFATLRRWKNQAK
ncbi:MAG: hydroxyacylglutathione hydrolase [Burkholderiales bacterium PBB3]|nr:MAG: hydroxyacylglutathione hydrolase [Burkholderiales bacterium PBB3]